MPYIYCLLLHIVIKKKVSRCYWKSRHTQHIYCTVPEKDTDLRPNYKSIWVAQWKTLLVTHLHYQLFGHIFIPFRHVKKVTSQSKPFIIVRSYQHITVHLKVKYEVHCKVYWHTQQPSCTNKTVHVFVCANAQLFH